MTILIRNRILQVFLVILIAYNGWRSLAPEFHERTIVETIGHGVVFLFTFVVSILVIQCILGAASAFLLKHRGVLGAHTLEITDEGLIERTEVNESLHKWSGIHRIISSANNLYIYVSSENFHLVPKGGFPKEEIAAFEQELRARANLR